MSDLAQQFQGYRLTTAEVTYRLPDHPSLLQTFLWQRFDLAPRYPVLQAFLAFWEKEIEAKIHSVRVGSVGIISAREWRQVNHVLRSH